jgi:hypothetical protein
LEIPIVFISEVKEDFTEGLVDGKGGYHGDDHGDSSQEFKNGMVLEVLHDAAIGMGVSQFAQGWHEFRVLTVFLDGDVMKFFNVFIFEDLLFVALSQGDLFHKEVHLVSLP